VLNDISGMFARTARKPMKFLSCGFEWRCSYMLTRLSLAAWGKQIGTDKKSGDLDYNVLRTPLTPLTDKEMMYCEYDLRVMYEGLTKYRDKYGVIKKYLLRKRVRYVELLKKFLQKTCLISVE
jgi:hypothetical protein